MNPILKDILKKHVVLFLLYQIVAMVGMLGALDKTNYFQYLSIRFFGAHSFLLLIEFLFYYYKYKMEEDASCIITFGALIFLFLQFYFEGS